MFKKYVKRLDWEGVFGTFIEESELRKKLKFKHGRENSEYNRGWNALASYLLAELEERERK